MELIEAKRELNNILFRKYHSANNDDEKHKYLLDLFNYNIDLVSYVIYNEFPDRGINYIEEGLTGLIIAIENYEMDKMCSFEEFILSNVRDSIINNIKETKKRF